MRFGPHQPSKQSASCFGTDRDSTRNRGVCHRCLRYEPLENRLLLSFESPPVELLDTVPSMYAADLQQLDDVLQPDGGAAAASLGTQGIYENWSTIEVSGDTHVWPAPAVAVDSVGNAHIAWRGDSNVYYTNAATGGRVLEISSGTASWGNPAVYVAPDDTVYVAWIDKRNGWSASDSSAEGSDLYFAKSSDGWREHLATPASNLQVMDPSIGVDSSGNVHVSYIRHTVPGWPYNHQLFHADEANGWAEERVSYTGADRIYESDMEIDSKGVVHIAFSNWGHTEHVWYANSSTGWENVQIDSNATAIWWDDRRDPAIAVDSKDFVHIVWQDTRNTDPSAGRLPNRTEIYHASSADGWVNREVALPVDRVGLARKDSPSVAVDPDGVIHVTWVWRTYLEDEHPDLFYGKSTDWDAAISIVNASSIAVSNQTLSVDRDGIPHITWLSGSVAHYATQGQIPVTGVAPTVFAGADHTVDEGSPFSGSGDFTDPGADTWTATVDYGDGTGVRTLALNADKTFDLGHTYADNGDYTLIVTVEDDDPRSGSDTLLVTVNNVAPAVVLSGDHAVDEGADYTLTLGTVTDPGQDTVSEWIVHWGDGLSDAYAGGGDPTHVYQNEGAYTVTVDLTDEDGTHLSAGSLDLTVNPSRPTVTDLGPVDFQLLEQLSLADGSLFWRVETSHNGVLSLQVDVPKPPKSARLKLYDADPVESPGLVPLTESALDEDANQRIDWLVSSGETYYVEVYGSNDDFGLRIVNLVHHDGTTVTVHGTDGDDAFEFDGSASRAVTVDGVRYHFDDAQVESVTFNGGDGYDMVILDDSAGDDTLTAAAKHAVFSNSDQTPGFTVTADAYEELQAYARSGGQDRAFLHDSDANDKFKSEPAENYAKMYGGRMYNRVKFFDEVEAFSSGEEDLARLFDTNGNDVFEGQRDASWLRTDVFDVGVHNFRHVIAYALEDGNDVATLKDSVLQDEVYLKSHKSQIVDLETKGEIYKITARSFDLVHADGSQGEGYDKVKMWDTAGDNLVEAAGNWARMFAQEAELEMIYDVLAFEIVKVRASTGGNDTANVMEPLQFDLLFGGWLGRSAAK